MLNYAQLLLRKSCASTLWTRAFRISYWLIGSPCPTYQLWPFSSAKENHPKMPIRHPQNEFPRVPWICPFDWHYYFSSLKGKPEFHRVFQHFPPESLWDLWFTRSREDEVEPRDGPTWNFHQKYPQNTPRAKILELKKIPPKSGKTT